jgi:hypothetical protein
LREPRTVTLVACCGPKLKRRAPAAELYTSDLFHKSVAYAKTVSSRWAILSAKYGLVMPGQVIAPYDLTLAKMSAAERRAWGKKVLRQIRQAFPPGTHFVILAGKLYVEPFKKLEGYSYQDPLKGMGFERKRWLMDQVNG